MEYNTSPILGIREIPLSGWPFGHPVFFMEFPMGWTKNHLFDREKVEEKVVNSFVEKGTGF
jgi:hypothetical protein